MELNQAIQLIGMSKSLFKDGPSQWADLGCGSGIFTSALAHLLPKYSHIIAIDKSFQNISSTAQVTIQFLKANFESGDLPLSNLDGILMANSLHYVEDKKAFLSGLQKYFKGKGLFILIEYDTLKGNSWVPFPIDMAEAILLFQELGYQHILKLGQKPSVFGRANIYAIAAFT